MKKVVILGGGISGLALGWFLRKKWGEKIDLKILEKSSRAGGWIRTLKEGGWQFETGPRGFRPAAKGEMTLRLVKDLGLQSALICANPKSKRRYICVEGKLRPFGPLFLLRQGILGAILHDLFTPKTDKEDETVADFITRRFNQRLAELVMDPLTRGIFGSDMHQLSMRSSFPSIWNFEQCYGSVIYGMWAKRTKKRHPPLYTFQGGMETLTTRLAQELKENLCFEQTVTTLQEIEADWVISTLPAYALAPLMGYEDPYTYSSLSLVHLGWQRNVLSQQGYGFLVPSQEKGEILGMSWDSKIFPTDDTQTRICVMIPGILTESELLQRAFNSLHRYLGIQTEPDVVRTTFAEKAMTQYTLHHGSRTATFLQKLPPHVKAIGNSFTGPGVNDCIFAAHSCAQNLQIE
jgi:protoporphyrinogen/coproporphyrinogen III oxidase